MTRTSKMFMEEHLMEDISYRLWQIASAVLEENLDNSLSFYGFLDLCKDENPEFFVEADIENIDIAVQLYGLITNEWANHYRYFLGDIVDHNNGKAKYKKCYDIICHLFEKEDFVSLFHSTSAIVDIMFSLKRLEREVCGDFYSWHRDDFERLYKAIVNRISISLI